MWELVRAAPVMVPLLYGVPIGLLLIGSIGTCVEALLVLLDQSGIISRPSAPTSVTMAMFVLIGFLALPVYWILTSTYALLLHLIHPPALKLHSHSVEAGAMHPGDKSAPGCLTVPLPVDKQGGSPPLIPWLPEKNCDPEKEWDPNVFRFKKIGIVLSGGGAKGVYQAGAMKAVYEFLAENSALGAVRAISGTSIGSWNAMFWLAGLLDSKSGDGTRSAHELWWRNIKLHHLVRPDCFVFPGVSTHLLSNAPWHQQFADLFAQPGTAAYERLREVLSDPPSFHFYFSRTNVLPGRLSFDTNNRMATAKINPLTHDLDLARFTTSLERLREAVFASMGIPPLFPYCHLNSQQTDAMCEDGGVIDNLPVRLPQTFDHCDLLFILPLNASFSKQELPEMMFTRLSRVIDMRGGILERAALKNIYLYNQLFVSEGKRNPVPAFVIAPGQPLHINTTELWKLDKYGDFVFDQMYRATRQFLRTFFSPDNIWNFYAAYDDMKKNKTLPECGHVKMTVVEPAWDDGNPFEYEGRF